MSNGVNVQRCKQKQPGLEEFKARKVDWRSNKFGDIERNRAENGTPHENFQ
jgi:hypothetical protein